MTDFLRDYLHLREAALLAKHAARAFESHDDLLFMLTCSPVSSGEQGADSCGSRSRASCIPYGRSYMNDYMSTTVKETA